MEDPDIQAGLRSLSASLDKMKELVAWQELEEAERKPGLPPSFQVTNHVVEDLRVQYGSFVKTALDAHEILNSKDFQATEVERTRWRQQVLSLESEVRVLGIGERLIRA